MDEKAQVCALAHSRLRYEDHGLRCRIFDTSEEFIVEFWKGERVIIGNFEVLP